MATRATKNTRKIINAQGHPRVMEYRLKLNWKGGATSFTDWTVLHNEAIFGRQQRLQWPQIQSVDIEKRERKGAQQ